MRKLNLFYFNLVFTVFSSFFTHIRWFLVIFFHFFLHKIWKIKFWPRKKSTFRMSGRALLYIELPTPKPPTMINPANPGNGPSSSLLDTPIELKHSIFDILSPMVVLLLLWSTTQHHCRWFISQYDWGTLPLHQSIVKLLYQSRESSLAPLYLHPVQFLQKT